MRKIFTLMIMVLAAALAMAQAPEKFTYQAVVRNASNVLVVNAPVGVRVSILQGGINGNLAYMETQTAVTNANGLITLQIGGGSVQQGVFADIDWANGPFFLKTETDPNGGSDYSVTSVQQLLSVPYALYSKEAGNGFSGDYNDLTNLPQIPQNVSELTNDAGYITMDSVPAIPTNVSAFNNDAGYLTGYTETDPQFNAWDKDYNDLINTPTIPTVPENVSTFTNDAGYITTAQIPAQVNADWNATTGVAQILNKPTIPTVPSNVSAFTNDAGYITSADIPEISNVPTNVSAFTNDAGYITSADVPAQVNADWNATSGAAQILHKPTLFSGNYDDLTNRPTIPTVPTNVSAFTNDAGYITSEDIPEISNVPTNVSAFTNDAEYITAADVPAQVNADWNATSGVARILNKPTIPTVPTNVGAFTNDAHYITEAQLNALLASMNSAIDSLRDRIEELEDGTSPIIPNPPIPDTTTLVIPQIVDGQACPGKETIYDYDGNPYPTVIIGQQCWMKTNLRTTHYSNGTAIGLSSATSSSNNNPYRYYPGCTSSNLNTYGYLYNWYAVMNGNESSNTNPSMVQGICPVGWHVPSNSEWSQLTNYVNSYAGFQCSSTNQYIAKALCSSEYWSSSTTNSCAVGYTPSNNNNATGFSALPAGYIAYSNYSYYVGNNAYFWSCTQSNSTKAYNIGLVYDSPTVGVYADGSMSSFYSVRCVYDSAVSGGGAQAVVTGFVNNVTSTTAQCGGSVVTDNGYVVTERGVCWSTSNPPMVYHNRTIDGAGMGSFVSNLTGLTPGTTYYVRAYAMTNSGTMYGGTVSFTTPTLCGTSTVKDYDQNVYHTVQIGDQCWMKENLRTTHYADGTAISAGAGSSYSEAYYYTPSGGSIDQGYLYNWTAVMRYSSTSSANPSGVQGVCPTGWHVPSDAEWAVLEDFVGGQDTCKCSNNTTYIAKALAATSGWTASTNTCAVGNGQTTNNKTGFGALPVGYKYGNNSNNSGGSGNFAYFWSSTQSDSDKAWYRSLSYSSASVTRANQNKYYGYSVRCLRD